MLKKCSSVLLLTEDEELYKKVYSVTSACDIELEWEREWYGAYRVTSDVVICDTEFASSLNASYYDKAVLVLGEGKVFDYREKFRRFIFNRENEQELMYSMLIIPSDIKQKESSEEVIKAAGVQVFRQAQYDFNFNYGVFKYNGKSIYLSERERKYLAEWLLMKHKDNSRRVVIYALRKRFGKDFLSDIDRHGNYKGKTK